MTYQRVMKTLCLRSQGFTLLEITIVTAIIGIIAIVMIQNLSSGNIIKLDLAANETATAIRFAKTETLRTGTPHGITTDPSKNQIRIYSLSSMVPDYNVYHPVDKKLYDIQFDDDSRTKGVDMLSSKYDFDGYTSNNYSMMFSKEGIPVFILLNKHYLLSSASINLSYGNDQRIVSIAPMTGRVTIQ
jgi:prepilin-type N-terminal cleavage/methylation domain-containing protein